MGVWDKNSVLVESCWFSYSINQVGCQVPRVLKLNYLALETRDLADATIIKDLFFNEINLLTEDINKETGLYMISLIAQLKDN